MNEEQPVLIDMRELARTCKISVRHAERMIASGAFGVEPIRLGRAVRFDRREVLDWIGQGCPDRASWQSQRKQ